MPRTIHYLFIAFIVYSCQPREQTIETSTARQQTDSLEAIQEEPVRQPETIATDTPNFTTAFNRFFSALQTSDTVTINTFIHPEKGLWVIEQPGAVPKMTHVTDIRNFKRKYQDRSFLTIKDEVKDCDLKEEAWPTFSCADVDYEKKTSGYSKDGCFVAGPGKFQKSGYWNYASLPESEIQTIKATLPFVQKSVLHTATSFEFHFGFIDGHWRLLFTKLIYPCSA
ncbi:hypothetical protein H7F15_17260 [Pontibacter sp. Tf4]|uniref:hypothetical protein n=1 Tax=Pontibacter sp. Tf4 TaxID=2761620 RepID=UPI001626A1C8|nr:hypothetical protein [Pontibacter sp. Tf4]MBB6612794.1 hypothetical protein [Pontibacter sp. Tf4]